MSVVEGILRQDPARVYDRMDFATRDSYRHAVERLSRRSRLAEAEIARQAVELAAAGSIQRHRSPGQARRPLPDREGSPPARAAGRRPPVARRSTGPADFLSGAGAAGLRHVRGRRRDVGPNGRLERVDAGGGRALALVCASHHGRGIDQLGSDAAGAAPSVAQAWISPSASRRTPAPWSWYRRLSLMPADVEELGEALEVRFLANRDDRLHFALLTDCGTRTGEHLPERCRDRGPGARPYRGAQRPVSPRRQRPVLPVPSSPSLESSGAGVDGPRAETGQARRPERTDPPRRRRSLLAHRGANRAAARRALRHHAGHGIPSFPAIRPASAPARWRTRSTGRVSSGNGADLQGYGILQPRVGVSLPGDQPLPLCRDCSAATPGSIPTPGCLRCVSGPVRGGLLYRKGHLRRRRVRAGAGRGCRRTGC